MQKLIDSISGIDLATVQPEQLRRMHGTFRCNSTGSGRDKKYSYRHGASTPIGDIEDSVWKTAAEAVVKRDGLEQEVTQILPYVSFASDTSAENRISAINAVFSGLYKDTLWVSFVEYNLNYHPELLVDAELVEVIPLCCNRAGQITADRLYYDRYSQTIPCPHCGRFSPFRWPEDVGEEGGNHEQDAQNA